MASVIAYYRPRSIQGNYKVGILLDLGPTELAKVFRWVGTGGMHPRERALELEKLGKGKGLEGLKPTKTIGRQSFFKKDQGKTEIYTLSRLNYDPSKELIEIEIHDKEIVKFQRNSYHTTEQDITGGLEKDSIEFIKITLIDLDNAEQEILQKYRSEIRQLRQALEEK